MIKFSPNGDRIVIRPFTEQELFKAKVNIIIPFGQSKEAAQQGVVVEAGPSSIYKVGQKVIFNPVAGDELRIPDEKGASFTTYRIMHCDTVHASFTDDSDA